MNENNLIAVNEIARIHSLHRASLHRTIKKLGLDVVKIASDETRGQAASHISIADYEILKVRLASDETLGSADPTSKGTFYLIKLEPEFDPGRFKVGYATNINERLRAHKPAAPLCELVKTWPCKLLWEKTAIDCVTQGCEKIHTEVSARRI